MYIGVHSRRSLLAKELDDISSTSEVKVAELIRQIKKKSGDGVYMLYIEGEKYRGIDACI